MHVVFLSSCLALATAPWFSSARVSWAERARPSSGTRAAWPGEAREVQRAQLCLSLPNRAVGLINPPPAACPDRQRQGRRRREPRQANGELIHPPQLLVQ
jgi:hypothetical protein